MLRTCERYEEQTVIIDPMEEVPSFLTRQHANYRRRICVWNPYNILIKSINSNSYKFD